MGERIQELPDLKEIYDLYNGRRPEEVEKDVGPIEKLEITDSKVFQAAINKFVEDIYRDYTATKENDPRGKTRSFEDEQMTKTTVSLGERVVDSAIPIAMDVYKNFTSESGKRTESINFYFYKDQEFVGNISIADHGNGDLDVIDRLTDPKFRNQGFGKILMDCAEAYIQTVATEKQKSVTAYADNIGQLDVIYWFWKNGYRPETEKDWQRLEMVLHGHQDLELAEKLWVFKKDTPDKDRYFTDPSGEFYLDGQGKRAINYNNAFRIRMVKSISQKPHEEVVNIVERVDKSLKDNELRGFLVDYLELESPEEVGKIKILNVNDLAGEYREQYEFLNEPELADVDVVLVPKELWKKGGQPSESHAEKGLILFNREYFEGGDKIAWLVHELAHCLAFKNHPKDYDKMSKVFAYDDLDSEYSYPNNQVEAFTFRRQFEYLKQKGAKKEEIVLMLKEYYEDEEDFKFFDRILGSMP